MYHLFEKFGIELEYMIVDSDSMKVLPVTDKVIEKASGEIQNEINQGEISWSNELALHVVELKTSEPVTSLVGLAGKFQKNILQINTLLNSINGMLLPGPMHPFMDPDREMVLWPHDYNPIYESFNRIFSCRGHGWSNLQSMHINLPFANDEEFGRLHAAIRLVLPIIPALSAGSPVADGKVTGFWDTRMEVYRTNSSKIPSITGDVIPEAVFSPELYHQQILEMIYRDLAPHDPEKILQEEWVNARGAIARFERNSIEIRVIDVQETPFADVAIAAAVIGVIRMLVEERLCTYEAQKRWGSKELKPLLQKTIKDGEHALIDDCDYLKALGYFQTACTAQQLWLHLVEQLLQYDRAWLQPFLPELEILLRNGTLATRILHSLGKNTFPDQICRVYRELGTCLEMGVLYK